MLVLTNTVIAQSASDSIKRTNPIKKLADSSHADTVTSKLRLSSGNDSLTATTKDSITNSDSLAKRNSLDTLGIKISPDALASVVTADAADSAVLNMKENIFELYGSAVVKYEDAQLDAHQVSYYQATNIVTAGLSGDSAALKKSKPTFTQGKEKFTYDSLQYNFKSKRAIVRNARSQYGEGFVNSLQVKRNPDQSIYGAKSVYTTCALEHPHFGINARRIKVVPEKVIASGPANLMVEDVPTPLILPFGLFPISQGQRSGFKIPTYTISDNLGIGLLDGGYYFAINDNVDLLATARFYSRGSWATDLVSYYANRYHYNGNLAFRYGYNKVGESYEASSSVTKDYKIEWTHRSDPKSRPGVDFSSSVVVGTATYNRNNTFTANQILQNNYTSNITFTRRWQNRPHALSVALRHSQNTQSRLVNVTLPSVSFTTTIKPFEGIKSVGTKWYEKINIQYAFEAINTTSFYDSTFKINELSFDKFQTAAKHAIPISATYNLLRFINVTPSISYNEYWMTQRMYRHYNTNTDKIDTTISKGFYTARDFNAGIGLNTRIYGTKMFKNAKIAGIRHVFIPRTGFAYQPDYASSPFEYGYQTRTSRTDATPTYSSVYEGNPYTPSGQFGKPSSAITFGVDNNLQIKVRSKKDSTGFKNIRIIDNFDVSSSYDLSADSFNLANFGIRFATMLFNVVNLSANAVYDPYAFDYDKGQRLKVLKWDVNHGLATFRSATISMGASLHPKKKENPAITNNEEVKRLMQYGGYNDYADFSIPFNLSFNYVLGIAKQYSSFSKSDTVVISQHSIGLTGDFNITQRWKVDVTTSYDFNSKKIQMTQIGITRDLHCWEMRISTIPFGPNKSYFFTLQVKATVLQDLKLIRQRNFRDAL